MNKRLVIILVVLAAAFVALLPYNLRRLDQARRDTAEADSIARRVKEAEAARSAQARDSSGLEQNRARAEASPKDPEALRAYAASLRAAGRPLDASYQVGQALLLNPNRGDLHQLLADVYGDLGYTDLAIEHLEEASRLEPSDFRHALILAYSLARLGKFNEAQDRLDRAIRAHPEVVDLHIALSVVQLAASNYPGAQQAAEMACRLAPADPKALSNLAKVYQRRAMRAEAAAVMQKAIDADPADPDNRVALAQVYMETPQRRAEARQMLETVIREQPNHLGAHYSLAQLLLFDRQYDRAISELNIVRQIQPKFPGAVHLLSQAYVKAGKIAERRQWVDEDRRREAEDTRLSHLQMRSGLQPSDHQMRADLAEEYIKRGRYGQALFELKAVPPGSPTASRARQLMEQAYLRSGRLVELNELKTGRKSPNSRITLGGSADAANAVNRSIVEQRLKIARNPRDVDAWLRLGVALGRSGDVEGSIASLDKAVELAPANPLAWRALAHAHELAGHRAEQITSLQRWVELSPNDSAALEQLAQTQLSAGWVPEAVKSGRAAVQLAPRSARARKMLARALFFQGDKTGATAELQAAKVIDPSDLEIDHELAANHMMGAEYPQARALLNGLLAQSPGYIPALLLRGTANEQDPLGDKVQAERDFKAVVAADPSNAMAHYNLGTLYLKLQRREEAAAELETATGLRPQYVDAMKSLAAVNMKLGRKAQAQKLIAEYRPLEALQLEQHRLQNRMSQAPQDASVRLALGRYYSRSGRLEDAIAEFSRGTQLAPSDTELRSALQAAIRKRPTRTARIGP